MGRFLLCEALFITFLLERTLYLRLSKHYVLLTPHWSPVWVQVDSTQNISEYDETTQAAIRKIMFEQKQKVCF
jgi:hypothetical protein